MLDIVTTALEVGGLLLIALSVGVLGWQFYPAAGIAASGGVLLAESWLLVTIQGRAR